MIIKKSAGNPSGVKTSCHGATPDAIFKYI
jgi:hypothetical protein